MAKSIPKAEYAKLKEKFSEVIKRGSKADIYFFFFHQAITSLHPGGMLIFIIPNRILSNKYATNLRNYIFKSCTIEAILTFDAQFDIFKTADVKPCILMLNKREKVKLDPKYLSRTVEKESDLSTRGFYSHGWESINLPLAEKMNIFFTTLSQPDQQLLSAIQKYPPIRSALKIHEGIRSFHLHYTEKQPRDIHIPAHTWTDLNIDERKLYAGELRGTEISRFQHSSPRFFLLIPGDSRLHFPVIQEKAIFIRELGKKMMATIISAEDFPYSLIGYGGVYYVLPTDVKASKLWRDHSSDEILFYFLAYFTSNFFLHLYSLLYASGSWGKSLKFRSSYIESLPFIELDPNLMIGLSKLQLNLHQNKKKNQEIKIKKEECDFVDSLIDDHIAITLILENPILQRSASAQSMEKLKKINTRYIALTTELLHRIKAIPKEKRTSQKIWGHFSKLRKSEVYQEIQQYRAKFKII